VRGGTLFADPTAYRQSDDKAGWLEEMVYATSPSTEYINPTSVAMTTAFGKSAFGKHCEL